MPRKILFTNTYSGLAKEIIHEETPSGFQTEFAVNIDEQIVTADYLIAGGRTRITDGILSGAKGLKMIQRSGVGLDTLDLDAIRKRGIPLYVNSGINAESAAEHSLLLILASLRRLVSLHENTIHGIWRKQEQGIQTEELYGKTVGIVGIGHIGETLARLLQPFHVHILYYDSRRVPLLENELGIQFQMLEELFHQSDIISLNCALTEETKGLINASSIQKMKQGVIIVNTARGELIELDALVDGLNNGKVSFAALDVHAEEPIPADYPLKKFQNVLLTPHVAGVTSNSFRRMMHTAFQNIDCFEKGQLDQIAGSRYL